MGCDYYIIKTLHIYYTETDFIELEVNKQARYYDELDLDEDDDNYENELNKYYQWILTPRTVPIIIYSNNVFNKSLCETKYKTLVQQEIDKKSKDWSEILKIIKVENRITN